MKKVRATYKRLDYNNGDFLAHYQWRVMQDSIMFVWGLFQDDEDGMWTIRNLFFNIVWLGDFADVFSVLGLTTTTETNWDDITK
ncbi:MAG: hypothetical protein J6Y11_03790 [Paludibacteraceae bacterium]|nr:hypothetical protein [Paludibacteraceae bacterium]